jgi:hypothetical protein
MILVLGLTGCGDEHGPVSPTRPAPVPAQPTPPTAPAPTAPGSGLSGTMTVTTSLTAAGGYKYTAQIQLTESAGVSATITAVELTLSSNGWYESGPYRFGPEAWGTNRTIPANGKLTSQPLVITDEFPFDYYLGIGGTITLSDASSGNRSMNVGTYCPPMPEPSPSSRFALVGTAKDAANNPVRDVAITVLDGVNAGRSTHTDAAGKYNLTDLKTGAFTIGWSKPEFKSFSYAVGLKSNLTVNLLMEKE